MMTRQVKFAMLLSGFIMISIQVFAQDTIPVRDYQYTKKPPAEYSNKLDLGIGLGMDYGGLLGFQVGFIPVKHLTLFAAAGYYVLGFGWQAGVKGLIIPKTTRHSVRPFLKGMYGTNSLIVVDGMDQYDKIYTGFTLGFGVEFRFGKKKQNGFDLDLNVPLRTPDFWEDWNDVKNNPSLEVAQEPLPVAISIGYHHEF